MSTSSVATGLSANPLMTHTKNTQFECIDAQQRIETTDTTALLDVFAAAFRAYQVHSPHSSLSNDLVGVVICGSFLAERFDPGSSDLDLILLCETAPESRHQDQFWQYANANDWIQERAQNCVETPVTRVDTCGLISESECDEFLRSGEPVLRPD